MVNHMAWRQTQRTAFKLAIGTALIGQPLMLMITKNIQPHYYRGDFRIAALAVLPAIAGSVLGYLSPYKASKGWLKASVLTMPLIAVYYAVCIGNFWRASGGDLAIVLSVVFGLIGTGIGVAIRKERRTRHSEIKLKNLPSH